MRTIAIIPIFLLSFSFLLHGEEKIDGLQEQARMYRQEGYKYQSRGEIGNALMFYQKAFELDPSYVEVINDLGVVYEAMGDEQRAIQMYERVLTLDPQYLPTHTNLAFLYEKRGDVKNASHYWKKRYELGQKGSYWWEVARQHLLALGTYPQIQREILEKKAAQLSRELVYQREQQRLMRNQEAKLHFDIGANLFKDGDYSQAIKEFRTAFSLNPPDKELKQQILTFHQKAERAYTREQALVNTEEALNSIMNDDFLSAGDKLKNALSAVFRIAREEKEE